MFTILFYGSLMIAAYNFGKYLYLGYKEKYNN